jgi:trans-aconitate methyltransferase
MSKKQNLADDYFDAIYSTHDDPWDFTTSKYEAEKYDATISSLPNDHYVSAFEIGCSIGVLTEKLAIRCVELLAVDVSDKALVSAKNRCKHLSQVHFKKMKVPQEFPVNEFDLILISEVGYFFPVDDWFTLVENTYSHLTGHGQIALVHWLPEVIDFPQTGEEVHESFAQYMSGKMQNIRQLRTDHYRIDIWQKD